MRASLGIALACLVLAGLSGCAGMQERDAYVPAQKAPSIMDQDTAYMAYVERTARRRGIEVVWVNVPRKRPADLASE